MRTPWPTVPTLGALGHLPHPAFPKLGAAHWAPGRVGGLTPGLAASRPLLASKGRKETQSSTPTALTTATAAGLRGALVREPCEPTTGLTLVTCPGGTRRDWRPDTRVPRAAAAREGGTPSCGGLPATLSFCYPSRQARGAPWSSMMEGGRLVPTPELPESHTRPFCGLAWTDTPATSQTNSLKATFWGHS